MATTKNFVVKNGIEANTLVFVGNSTINLVANGTLIKLSNSTSNASISIPSAVQYAATNVFLHANGSWVTVTGGGSGTPSGSNTEVQFNDSGAFGGNAGFTFTKSTNVVSIGNSTTNATVNSSLITVASAAHSSNVFIGNSTVNVVANSTVIKLSNSTVNTSISVPSSVQYSATNYFLHANGSWVQISAGGGSTPGGSNTEVQFNDSGALIGNAGFTFTKSTNVVSIGNSTVNTLANSTVISTAAASLSANATIGANVLINTVGVFIGNSTVNAIANSTIVKLANSTSNLTLSVPSAAAWSATNYFLHANGSWVQVTTGGGSSPGGSNTEIQFNDSGTLIGNAGFTFTKSTNVVSIGNSTVNTLANSTVISTAAAVLSANISVGANVLANSTAFFVGNSTVNITVTKDTIAGGANATLNVASVVSLAAGANVVVSTTGYSIGNSTVNTVANSIQTTLPATGIISIGNSTVNVVANSTQVAIPSSGILSVGNTTVNTMANSTVVSSAAASLSANATVGANVLINTTGIFIGNSTVNALANSTIVKLANSTSNLVLSVPSAAAWSATNYFLHANGSWVQVTTGGSATPGGSNTEVQFNDSGVLGGNAGFTFTKSTNVVSIGNSTVNTLANSTVISTAAANFSANIAVGANATINVTTIRVGNSTTNSVLDAATYSVGNSTVFATVNSTVINVGTYNATTAMNVGANVTLSTSFLSVGNSTVNAVANATVIKLATGTPSVNTTITAGGTSVFSGNIAATDQVIASFSDRRLKTDIYPITGALNMVDRIGGYYFRPNDLAVEIAGQGRAQQVGVLAQEIKDILPQVVHLAPFDRSYDSSGNIISFSNENYLTVQYEKLVPLLIQAIKELKVMVESKTCNCGGCG